MGALQTQLISVHLFIAGRRCLAQRMGFRESSLLTAKQKELPVFSKFCSSQEPPYLKVLVRHGDLR